MIAGINNKDRPVQKSFSHYLWTVEKAAPARLESNCWSVPHGGEIAPGGPGAERDKYGEVVLLRRLRNAMTRLDADLRAQALEAAVCRLTRPEGVDLSARDRSGTPPVGEGVTFEPRRVGGEVRGGQARVIRSVL